MANPAFRPPTAMNPSTQQHSFFAPPDSRSHPRVLRAPRNPARKRRTPHADPSAPGCTAINQASDRSSSSSSSEHEPSEPPHVDPKSHRGGHTKRYHAILTTHNLPPPPSLPYSLRTKHTTALIALLHRTLLERDYPRARRAFGLLLRSKNVDVRPLWRLGVEILQHTHAPLALELLERLVLEFPHTANPARPSALLFYPALLNLRVKIGGAEGAADVKERVGALTLTPPWTNLVGLWLMRGMVCNWMADLQGEEGPEGELRGEAETCFAKVREMGGEVPEGAERGDDMEEDGDVEGGEDGSVDADTSDGS